AFAYWQAGGSATSRLRWPSPELAAIGTAQGPALPGVRRSRRRGRRMIRLRRHGLALYSQPRRLPTAGTAKSPWEAALAANGGDAQRLRIRAPWSERRTTGCRSSFPG